LRPAGSDPEPAEPSKPPAQEGDEAPPAPSGVRRAVQLRSPGTIVEQEPDLGPAAAPEAPDDPPRGPRRSVVLKPVGSATAPPEEAQEVAETPRPTGDPRMCPGCGNTAGNQEVQDPTNIISYIPRVTYGKKMVCPKCGSEWKK
jgi:hypothetical protein